MEVRKSVRWFAEQMERKLREHDDRDGWEHEDYDWLTDRIYDELMELKGAVFRFEVAQMSNADRDELEHLANAVSSEAADVANFAHMVADNARHNR
jgi:hypothetical protein